MYEQVHDWAPEIQKISKKVEHEWPGIMPADDIEQEVYLHIIDRPGTLRDLCEMDEISRYRTLSKIAHRIVSGEREEYEKFSGNLRYSISEVQSMLEEIGEPESELGSSWKTGDYTSSGEDHSDPTSDLAIKNVEVSHSRQLLSEALDDLSKANPRQYDALIDRYVFGIVPDRKDTGKFMMIDRALHSVTTKMNRLFKRQQTKVSTRHNPLTGRDEDDYQPYQTLGDGPGTRSVFSNSTSRELSGNDWDGEEWE